MYRSFVVKSIILFLAWVMLCVSLLLRWVCWLGRSQSHNESKQYLGEEQTTPLGVRTFCKLKMPQNNSSPREECLVTVPLCHWECGLCWPGLPQLLGELKCKCHQWIKAVARFPHCGGRVSRIILTCCVLNISTLGFAGYQWAYTLQSRASFVRLDLLIEQPFSSLSDNTLQKLQPLITCG